MKVYLVTSGCYSDYGVVGAFSTKELAETFLNGAEDKGYGYRIEDYDLDNQTECIRRYWECCILLDSSTRTDCFIYGEPGPFLAGAIYNERSDVRVAPVDVRVQEPQPAVSTLYCHFGKDSSEQLRCIWRCSYVSKEHAQKLAVEARQKWLREQL